MAGAARLASAGLLAVLAMSAAHGETISLSFEGEAYRVLRLGEAHFSLRLTQTEYAADGRIRSAGLAALFADTNLSAGARGVRTDASLVNTHYDLDQHYAGVHRVIRVRRAGSSVTASAHPGFSFIGDPLPSEAQKREGRDPLTTLAMLGLSVRARLDCPASQRVYDGRYVYDLSFDRPVRATADTPVYQGATLTCRMRQTRIAGYRTPSDLAKRMPDAEITFALDAHHAFAPPLKVSAPMPLGRAMIRLRRITTQR